MLKRYKNIGVLIDYNEYLNYPEPVREMINIDKINLLLLSQSKGDNIHVCFDSPLRSTQDIQVDWVYACLQLDGLNSNNIKLLSIDDIDIKRNVLTCEIDCVDCSRYFNISKFLIR